MNLEMIIVFAVLLLAVYLFVTEKLPVELVALPVMALLPVSGIVSPAEGVSGFSNTATITIGAMFILSAGLFKTGAVNFLGGFVNRIFKKNFWAAILFVLFGCLTLEKAYQAIEWKIIFLLAGVLSLGIAPEKSGAARMISAQIVSSVGLFGLVALVSAFYLPTSLLTETISNNATAVLFAPVAIATAATLGVNPQPFLVAVTFAASASFMTPVGYQTNTMIYGPGQYKFIDFVKVGTPLNVILWLTATVFIPVFWKF